LSVRIGASVRAETDTLLQANCQDNEVTDRRVRYARNGDAHLAYRIFGDAGPTLVWVPGWVISNVDTYDDPNSPYAPLIESIAQSARIVVMDRRGTGLSDPVTRPPSLDERVDDLRAVLDSVDVDRPTFVGSGEGGSICILFAATHPERIHSLILFGSAPRFSQELPDYPLGLPPKIAAQLDDIENNWGNGALVDLFYGSTSHRPGVKEMFGKFQRSISSPMLARFWWQALVEVDVRDVLGAVRAPTPVLARQGTPSPRLKRQPCWPTEFPTRCSTRLRRARTTASTSSAHS
jgi:pimeloyl-ACP methyl ester carboxylesterase